MVPAMATKVISLVSEHPSYQIWVTGHSLGGAMASLASTWLAYYNIAPRKNIILYTFGMPRVGDYEYALQHDRLVNNSWRVVNDDNLVPHFPTLASISVLNGPCHHGVEAFYNKEATSVYSPHKECHGKPYNEDVTCSLSEVPRSIEKQKTTLVFQWVPSGRQTVFPETLETPNIRQRISVTIYNKGKAFERFRLEKSMRVIARVFSLDFNYLTIIARKCT